MKRQDRRSTRLTATATIAGLAAAASGAAHAVWEVVPEFELQAETDDNPRLAPNGAQSGSRTELDARLRLRNFGQRGSAYIEPRFVTEAYADARNKDLENDDIYLITRADYDWPSVGIGWRSNFREESILRAEFEDAIPDDPEAIDPIETGSGTLGTFDEQRRRLDASFFVDFALSQRTDLQFQVSHIDVAYTNDNAFIVDRTDFDDTTFSAALTRAVTPRNQVSARVFVSEFTALGNDNNTDAFGVEGSFTRPLSETWAFSLTAGVERTDYRFIDDNGVLIDNADSNFTFGFDLERQVERTRWNFSAGRFITPNSNGFLSERNQMRAVVQHDFTPRVTGSIGARFSQISRADEAQSRNERDYWRASFEIAWAMTPRWSVTGGLDSISEQFSSSARDASSNAVFVGLRYRGLSQP